MWQTVGQPKVVALLKHSLEAGSLAHAYLFIGLPHVGKTTLALDLACALNCDSAEPPCGECASCRRILDGKYADVTFLGLNSAAGSGKARPKQEIGINDVKELQRSASLSAYEGKYKIFIVDGAEYLSDEAANCLLKVLEEPPSNVIILILTSKKTRLLATLVSRCQQIELQPLSVEEVERILIEVHDIDVDKAKLLAHLSQGCLGWALIASDDEVHLQQRAGKISDLLSLFSAGWEERFAYAARLENDRKSGEEIIKLWLSWWRDVMLVKCDCKQSITNVDYTSTLESWAESLGLLEIRDFINSLCDSLKHVSRNANLQLVFEVLILNMPGREGKPGQKTMSIPGSYHV